MTSQSKAVTHALRDDETELNPPDDRLPNEMAEKEKLLSVNKVEDSGDSSRNSSRRLARFEDILKGVTFRIGLLYGVLSGVSLALQMISVRILMDTMPAEQIMFSRSIGMTVLMFAVSWEESQPYDTKDMALYLLYGVTNVTGIYLSYIALNYTNVGNVNAIALNLTISTAILSYIFLREAITICLGVLFLINLVGIILVSDPQVLFVSQERSGRRDFYGVLFALVSMLAMSLSRIVARKSSLRGRIDTSLMTVMSGVVGAPFSLVLSVLFNSPWIVPSMTYEWIWLLIYILTSIGANQFAMLGLKHEPANNISILSTLSVPISYCVSHLYFHENIKIIHIVGTSFILGSTAGSYFQM